MFLRGIFSVIALLGAWTVSATTPAVFTDVPDDIKSSSALLEGSVNPFSKATGAWFEWGTTTNYGNVTAVTNLPATFASYVVSTQVLGLAPSTTYHYRAVATNSDGVSLGTDVSFNTAPAPLFAEISNSFRGSY